MLALAFALLLAGPCLGADLVGTLQGISKASTLVQKVIDAGLVDTLKGGTFTVFAPTDAAFNRLPQATLDALKADPSALADILKYHVVPGSVASTDLRNEEMVPTANGKKIRVNLYTHNHIADVNGIKISQADVKADNGMIHFIDEVLIPPTKTIVELVAEDPELSTLLSAVTKAGIANEFQADHLTLFAPTNAAFSQVSDAALNKLLGDNGRLKETLEYHAFDHTLFANGLWNNEFPQSIDSHDDRVRIEVHRDGRVEVNNNDVVQADILATNGVIHKIDGVLIPTRVGIWLRLPGTGK
jgi:transforming growth factor-beta-induced protein